MSIEVRSIVKRFGSFSALDDVSLTFPAGQLVALLGPSGCGKTTLLRVIAGLEVPDSGEVLFHGENASDRDVRQRQVGFVFQHYALFRDMSVFENVAFGLRVKPRAQRPSNAEIRRKVHELLQLVQLDWLADRYPHQLSGGQRQRIALARALAVEPKVLLLDEPFGALDAKVRKELRRWLRRLHDDLHITSIFVTHDQEEALEVADQVVLMNKGKVEQVGSPDAVYERPATPFVYGFLGSVNVFHGRAHDGRLHLGPVSLESPEHRDVQDTPAVVYARPHEIEIERFSPGVSGIAVQLNRLLVVGPTARLELEREDTGEIVEAELPAPRARALNLKLGETLVIFPRCSQVFIERPGEAAVSEKAAPEAAARVAAPIPVTGVLTSH
jgi:sulfate transport system ATP-binding protein